MPSSHVHHNSTHPGVIFDHPLALVGEQVHGDLLTHQVHAVVPPPLPQVLTHRGPEGHQAGDATPVAGPIPEQARCNTANEIHVIPSFIQ